MVDQERKKKNGDSASREKKKRVINLSFFSGVP